MSTLDPKFNQSIKAEKHLKVLNTLKTKLNNQAEQALGEKILEISDPTYNSEDGSQSLYDITQAYMAKKLKLKTESSIKLAAQTFSVKPIGKVPLLEEINLQSAKSLLAGNTNILNFINDAEEFNQILNNLIEKHPRGITFSYIANNLENFLTTPYGTEALREPLANFIRSLNRFVKGNGGNEYMDARLLKYIDTASKYQIAEAQSMKIPCTLGEILLPAVNNIAQENRLKIDPTMFLLLSIYNLNPEKLSKAIQDGPKEADQNYIYTQRAISIFPFEINKIVKFLESIDTVFSAKNDDAKINEKQIMKNNLGELFKNIYMANIQGINNKWIPQPQTHLILWNALRDPEDPYDNLIRQAIIDKSLETSDLKLALAKERVQLLDILEFNRRKALNEKYPDLNLSLNKVIDPTLLKIQQKKLEEQKELKLEGEQGSSEEINLDDFFASDDDNSKTAEMPKIKIDFTDLDKPSHFSSILLGLTVKQIKELRRSGAKEHERSMASIINKGIFTLEQNIQNEVNAAVKAFYTGDNNIEALNKKIRKELKKAVQASSITTTPPPEEIKEQVQAFEFFEQVQTELNKLESEQNKAPEKPPEEIPLATDEPNEQTVFIEEKPSTLRPEAKEQETLTQTIIKEASQSSENPEEQIEALAEKIIDQSIHEIESYYSSESRDSKEGKGKIESIKNAENLKRNRPKLIASLKKIFTSIHGESSKLGGSIANNERIQKASILLLRRLIKKTFGATDELEAIVDLFKQLYEARLDRQSLIFHPLMEILSKEIKKTIPQKEQEQYKTTLDWLEAYLFAILKEDAGDRTDGARRIVNDFQNGHNYLSKTSIKETWKKALSNPQESLGISLLKEYDGKSTLPSGSYVQLTSQEFARIEEQLDSDDPKIDHYSIILRKYNEDKSEYEFSPKSTVSSKEIQRIIKQPKPSEESIQKALETLKLFNRAKYQEFCTSIAKLFADDYIFAAQMAAVLFLPEKWQKKVLS